MYFPSSKNYYFCESLDLMLYEKTVCYSYRYIAVIDCV